MTTNDYDVIVIGGGHNGLTAAALLAKKGKKVLLLERAATVGGMSAGEEFHPGYRTAGLHHDTSGVSPEVADALRLSQHGLRFHEKEPAVLACEKGGPGLLVHRKPADAAEEISRYSSKDAESYAQLMGFFDRVRPFLRKLQSEAPPQAILGEFGFGSLLEAGKKGLALRMLGEKDVTELLRTAPMCVADGLNNYLDTPILKTALAAPALWGTYTGPWSPGSHGNLLFWEGRRGRSVVGGAAALVKALESAARGAGAEIATSSAVEEILVEGSVVRGVKVRQGSERLEVFHARTVVSACDAKETLLNLVPSTAISHTLEHRMENWRTRGTTSRLALALNGPVPFAGREGQGISLARTAQHFDEMERAFDPVKYGTLPEHPVLEVSVPTVEDPALAPDGHHVASVWVHFTPHDLRDQKWDGEKEALMKERVLKVLETYAPGIGQRVVGSAFLSPVGIEKRFAAPGGHVYHGEPALDQLFARPSPETARYATPIDGLYLCGGGNHPGGGVTCLPAANGVAAVLKG